MRWLWPNLDLQGKFRLLMAAGLALWMLNFFIVYFGISEINKANLVLERYEDLYDTILEIRRYEKNFLLYKNRENIAEALDYLQHARKLYAQLTDSAETGPKIDLLRRLNKDIEDYNEVLNVQRNGLANTGPTEESQEQIRSIGKRMVDRAHELMARSRSSVALMARRGMRWLLMTTGLILVLFAVGAVLVNRKVIRPLVTLERATEKIGRGDFGPIHHHTRIESEVDRLVVAFNRMVEELEARQEQIIHSRKIASLGTLVSGVAHELNNPINNIILTIDTLVGKRQITNERRAALLEDILNQAIRASGIVKNLLDFSRAEATAVQEVDIGQLVKETIQLAENQISLNKINLSQEIDPALPAVRGSRQGLQQVFLNLILNAVQAMPGGGDLTVRTVLDKEARIVFTVQDTGVGIAPENLPHIFDPFFTTKEVGQGTGLGLSVSYGIIKKHGGRITVDSAPGKGSTFAVILPTNQEPIDG